MTTCAPAYLKLAQAVTVSLPLKFKISLKPKSEIPKKFRNIF